MKLAIIAEYDAKSELLVQTEAAIAHSSRALEIDVRLKWLSTSDESMTNLKEFDGIWFAPGSPYRNLNRTLEAVRFVREHNVPTLGTCGGFQHMVIEFARNVCLITDAQHAEYDPYASRLTVYRLACSLAGREMEVSLTLGSRTAAAYGKETVIERYYCNFGINPEFVDHISSSGFHVVGADRDGECRIMEIPEHRLFYWYTLCPAGSIPTGSASPAD